MTQTRTMSAVFGVLAAAGLTLVPSASASPLHAGPERHSMSLNRAGYGATGDAIRHVSAAWRQPSATCATGATYANFRVSMARLGRPLMVGTATDCHAGQPVFYAWTNFGGRREKLDGSVAAGDEIQVKLDASKHQIAYSIENDTEGWAQGSASAGGRPPHFTRADILVQARTASGSILPLTNFGRIFFRHCTVNGQLLGTQHTHEIVMKSPLGDEALPTPIVNDRAFAVYKPTR
jgi:hypothetical protein